MKKSLVVGFVLFTVLFFGCGILTPPDVQERALTENGDSERKDVLALAHLQIPHISEDTLASYVMDFINANDASRTARSVQSVQAVAITKTTRIMHPVETGFAETTADKRSARSVIGPGQIPFYVFTLENQNSGKTGFALTCGDSRIGAVLAVAEAGNYDDVDNPFMGIFYTGLNLYIENTIAIYNSITEADIENALNKLNEARNVGFHLPVTDVGVKSGLDFVGSKDDGVYNNDKCILETEWHQHPPYNDVIMSVKNPSTGYKYIAGCGSVAIAQVMAFHGKKRAMDGKKNPYSKSNAPGYTKVEYDWVKMIAETNKGADEEVDKEAIKAVAVLMYEIGLPKNANSHYLFGGTATTRSGVINAFKEMGYQDPGSFKAYNFEQVKTSINAGYPVVADGSASGINLFGITIATPVEGHYWVIDGYRRMAAKLYNKVTDKDEDYNPHNYVHCNLGWTRKNVTDDNGISTYDNDGKTITVTNNGWYISGVFDTEIENIPLTDDNDTLRSATQKGLYQYGLGILTGIKPKN